MFTVLATATDYIVVSTSTQANFTISSENNLFTITNQTTNFSISSTQTAVTVATLAGGFEFDANFLGNWVSGSTYTSNNLVNYQYSLYVLHYTPGLQYTSTTPPSQDSNWRRVVWHEAPFDHLTVTNTATILGPAILGNSLSVASSATIGDDLTVAGDATINGNATFVGTLTTDWIVTENFVLNGLTYPHSRGAYGQVLFTNGTDIANWVNLGDLQNWSLSEDLYTNGFNIQTGDPAGSDPNPQLTIGSGANGSFKTSIKFNPVANSATTGTIDVKGSTTFNDHITVKGNTTLGNVFVQGTLYGGDTSTPAELYGIKFPDGSVLTTTYITTSSGFPIASHDRLGVIKVGNNLSISEDGTLSASTTSDYRLPAASGTARGGIRVGSGLQIIEGDILTANYSTASIGIISLSQNAYTNGYKIIYDSNYPNNRYLEIGLSSIKLAGSNANFLSFGSVGATFESSSNLGIAGSTVNISGTDTVTLISKEIKLQSENIKLQSTSTTIIGSDGSHSILRVQNIYNYAGTYAPTFPAGIQFGDNSVQVTAFQTSTLYQQFFDFQNPYDP